MSFYTSLSGLRASQSDMATISHNVANVGTNGFKRSRTEFVDVIASSFTTDPRRAVGSGTAVAQNKQLFGEGSLITTGSSLDMAVSGDGFFTVKSADATGAVSYTQNGSFEVDPDHYVVDANGNRLQAFAVETDGTVPDTGALVDVAIPVTSGEPQATGNVALRLNLNSQAAAPTGAFDRANGATYTSATSTTIFDDAGTPQVLTNYFVRQPGDANSWTMYSFAGDQQLGDGTTVAFNGDGQVASGPVALTFPAAAGGQERTVTLSLAGSTARAQPFEVAARTQDGVTPGEFSGITVDAEGLITASYANGDSVKLGRVALANFVNPAGLRQMGGSYWTSTGLSGEATMGSANQNGFGKLMSGTVEGSNVDITEELVSLIAAQRNFQANAKALDTASQISQTIFNIRT
jgi:flagellar hook protein FlgE